MEIKKYYQNTRKEMLTLLPPHATYEKVLEVGCGVGNFKKNLSHTCEYWGIEPNNNAATVASKSSHKVLTGTYEEVSDNLPNNYFDLIICNDVIEHMIDHDSFLIDIKEKMSKNGSLIASIPNVRYIENLYNLIIKKDWEYMDDGILDRTHLRFFTEKSLKKIINQHNYTIDEFQYLNNRFDHPHTLGSLFKKLLVFILGKDTQYLHFGIRLNVK